MPRTETSPEETASCAVCIGDEQRGVRADAVRMRETLLTAAQDAHVLADRHAVFRELAQPRILFA